MHISVRRPCQSVAETQTLNHTSLYSTVDRIISRNGRQGDVDMETTVFHLHKGKSAGDERSSHNESERLRAAEAQHVIWRRIPVRVKSLQKPCIFV